MSMVTRMRPLVIMMMLKTISSHSVVLSKLPKVLKEETPSGINGVIPKEKRRD